PRSPPRVAPDGLNADLVQPGEALTPCPDARARSQSAPGTTRKHLKSMAEAFDLPSGALMRGKRGFVMGVANHQSIAWGIASQLAAQGAELAFLHLPGMERRVQPLADSIG